MAEKLVHIVNEEKSEICIFGYIGSYDTVNWKQFQSDFNALAKNSSDVTIRINSNGGDMIEGFAMFDTIRNSKSNVTGIVEGIAASMAGIIFLACDKRLINENARLMIHRPRGFCSGEKESFETHAQLMQQEEDKLINALTERSGQKAEVVKSWLKPGSQTWMDAKTAIKNGLADDMVKSTKKVKITNSLLENIEEAIGIYNTIENKESKKGSMKKILTVLSAFSIANSLNEESSDSQVAEVVENALKAKDQKITELENKLKEQNDKAVENALDSAVKEGKITAEQKADWKPILENNMETGMKLLGNLQPRVDVNKVINSAPGSTVTNGIPADRKDWNIRKWESEDPTGLENMLKNNPQEYERLSKEYYGA